jgi:hypothetical protein
MYKLQYLKLRFCIAFVLMTILLGLSGCHPEPEQKPKPTVDHIHIHSNWIGDQLVDFPTVMSIDISRKGNKFVGFSQAGFWDDRKLPKQSITASELSVKELLDALQAKPELKISLNELKMHPYQLQAEINSQFNDFLKNAPVSARRDLLSYKASLYRNGPLTDMLSIGYKSGIGYTHDYPNVRVRINLSDGKELTAESNSERVMMLPWKVNGGAQNFSVRISKAVAALLPEGSINRARLLNPVEQEHYLAAVLYNGMQPTMSRIVFDRMVPRGYKDLSKRFNVSDIDYSKRRCTNSTPCFSATLRLPVQPKNLRLMTQLTINDDSLSVIDLDRYESMLKRVIDSPLMHEIQAHPDHNYLIYGSFGKVWSNPDLVAQFVSDMTANGKMAVIPTDMEILNDAVLVSKPSDVYWVLFSNRQAVQWMRRVKYNQKISGKPCFEPPNEGEKYGSDNWGYQCVGEYYNAESMKN